MLAQINSMMAATVSSPHATTGLEHGANGYVTDDGKLSDRLGLKSGAAVDDIIKVGLLNPVTSNHGKRIRGKLVTLSYRLLSESGTPSNAEAVQCGMCAEVVELIHAGSLVVDDIEDGSMIRRGKAALHIRYGLPTALNAGNWLYFWPFQLIKALELPNRTALSVYEDYHRTLLRAHVGRRFLFCRAAGTGVCSAAVHCSPLRNSGALCLGTG